MEINYKKLNSNAIEPKRGSAYAAGYDLHACINEMIAIAPNETVKIPTGLAIEVPEGYFGAIFARSGLAIKQGLRPCNAVGVIDSDFRGNVTVALKNDSNDYQRIYPNDRIAQLVIIPFLSVEFDEVDELEHTERGVGGFGSTGVR